MSEWRTLDLLTQLTRVDCPTPKCRANAAGTGRARRDERGQWYVEYACPDCRETWTSWRPETQRLLDDAFR